MTLIRRSFFGLLIAIGLLLTAAIVAFKVTDFSQFKPEIQAQVKKLTGLDLIIAGKLKPIIGFDFSLLAEDIRLSNADWAQSDMMLDAKRLEFDVALLPLLFSNQLKVNKVLLEEVTVNLEQNNSKANWQFTPSKAAPEKNTARTIKDHQQGDDLDIDIANFNAQNVRINYIKDTSSHTLIIHSLTLTKEDDATLNFAGQYNDIPIAATVIADSTQALMRGNFDVAVVSNLHPSGKYTLKASVEKESDRIKISDLEFSSANSDLKGEIEIFTSQSKPIINTSLNSDKLILGDFLMQPEKSNASPSNMSSKPPSNDSANNPIPFDLLNQFNATLSIDADHITHGKINIYDATLEGRVRNGVLKIDPLEMQLSKGTLNSAFTASATRTPTAKFTLNAKQLNVGLLVKEALGNYAFDGGLTDIAIKANTKGHTVNDLLSSLNGNIFAYMNEAVFQKPNTIGQLQNIITLLSGSNAEKNIATNCAMAHFDIKRGTASIKALSLDSKFASVTASGDIYLDKQAVNMVVTPDPKTRGLIDLALPLKIKGPLSNPSIRPEPVGTALTIANNIFAFANVPVLIGKAGLNMAEENGIVLDKEDPCVVALGATQQSTEPKKEQPSSKRLENELKHLGNELKNLFNR